MSSIISANLIGGLGNQLFSVSHALCQGWKHNRPVLFLPKSYTPKQGRTTDNYLKNVFRNINFTNVLNNSQTVKEKTFEFTPVKPHEENTIFDGYFQSTKHWYGFENEIQEIFNISSDQEKKFIEKYPNLNNEKTVSLHIRRSDYLETPEVHPTISIDYIFKSIEKIGDYSNIFIFTDDKNWVYKNLNLNDSIIVSENEDWEELYLMSLCKNNIISNSTFSWWGSFLNKNKNKRIIAPSMWFGPKGPNAKDIYDPSWELIDVYYDKGFLIPKND